MVFDDHQGPVKRCETCTKLCFTSRKQAKRYMHRKFPKNDMTIYRCRDNPDYFHFGHTPWQVRNGTKERGRVA